jgi:hypothetical protein
MVEPIALQAAIRAHMVEPIALQAAIRAQMAGGVLSSG